MKGIIFDKPLCFRLLGAAVILLGLGWLTTLTRAPVEASHSWSWRGFWWSSRPTQKIELQGSQSFQRGDPVFLEQPNGKFIFVGDVIAPFKSELGTQVVTIRWRSETALPNRPRVEYYETPKSLAWVAKTLLPPEKKKRVIQLILETYEAEGPKLNAKLMPVLRNMLQKSLPSIEKKAIEYLQKERGRVHQIGYRYQENLVQQKLIPLLRRDVMPIVEKHAEPVVERIGSELWDRASIWRFGWRYAYDVLPLTNRNLVQAEWRRFVEEEAIPVLESHVDEIIEVQKKIIVETASTPAVRQAAQEALGVLIEDEELRRLMGDVFEYAVVENDELHEVLEESMQSPTTQEFMSQLESSLQPLANQIGVELFGTPDEGLTPELVAVLRSQVLGKDQRWIVVKSTMTAEDSNEPLPGEVNATWIAKPGNESPFFPFQQFEVDTNDVDSASTPSERIAP